VCGVECDHPTVEEELRGRWARQVELVEAWGWLLVVLFFAFDWLGLGSGRWRWALLVLGAVGLPIVTLTYVWSIATRIRVWLRRSARP
jgi:hypothetical protein